MSYPGIEIKVELIVLQEYLNQLESSIQTACDRYIENELSKYKNRDYEEYSHIYRIAETEIPRIIRLPVLVSMYALYESSMSRLLTYAQGKESKTLGLNDIRARSMSDGFNKYSQHVLGFDYQIAENFLDEIKIISKIRNIIAHTNGNLTNEQFNDFRRWINEDIEIQSNQLDITYPFINKAMQCIRDIIESLMKFLENTMIHRQLFFSWPSSFFNSIPRNRSNAYCF